jgi:hypothetical protein
MTPKKNLARRNREREVEWWEGLHRRSAIGRTIENGRGGSGFSNQWSRWEMAIYLPFDDLDGYYTKIGWGGWRAAVFHRNLRDDLIVVSLAWVVIVPIFLHYFLGFAQPFLALPKKMRYLALLEQTYMYCMGRVNKQGTSAPCSMDGGWTRDTFSLYSHP